MPPMPSDRIERLWQILTLGLLGFLLWTSTLGPAYETFKAAQRANFGYSGPGTWDVDVDAAVIHRGITAHRTFASTLPWWWGPWGPGEPEIPGQPGKHVAFYRPLSSLVFWLEWRAFGNNEAAYLLVNAGVLTLNALLFLLVSLRLFARFTIRPRWAAAFFAVLGYLTGFGVLINTAASGTYSLISTLWKNLPDALALFFVLLTVLGYLWSTHTKRPARSCLAWLIPLALGSACKEVVSLFALVLMSLEWREWREPSTRIRLSILATFLVLFQAGRLAALHGAGFLYGSNDSWWIRLLGAIYPFGPILAMQKYTEILLSVSILLAVFLVKRVRLPGWKWALLCVGWLVAVILLNAWFVGTAANMGADQGSFFAAAWLDFFVLATYPANLLRMLSLLTGAVAFRQILRKPDFVVFTTAWIVFTTLPNLASPGPIHRDYVPNAGWALLYGASFTLLGVRILAARAPKP